MTKIHKISVKTLLIAPKLGLKWLQIIDILQEGHFLGTVEAA